MSYWEQIVFAILVVLGLARIIEELQKIRKFLEAEVSFEKTNDLLVQIESHASDLVHYEKKRFQPPPEY